MGPTQTPPTGNVPGVVWNRSANGPEQAGVEYNIGGNARVGQKFIVGDDILLKDSKALRIDSLGMSTFNIGNWGDGPQPLWVNVYGDFAVQKSGAGIADGAQGRVGAEQFCLYADGCISVWPVASEPPPPAPSITSITAGLGLIGGGSEGDIQIGLDANLISDVFVDATGDTMYGELYLYGDPTSEFGASTKRYVDNSILNQVTSVVAGASLVGGGSTGEVTLDLNPQYSDGSAYDGRFLNVAGGDTATGKYTFNGPFIVYNVDNVMDPHGISATGKMYGFYGFGLQAGGRFQNNTPNISSGGSIGEPFAGGLFNGPEGGYGVFIEPFSGNDYGLLVNGGKSKFKGSVEMDKITTPLELSLDLKADNNVVGSCISIDTTEMPKEYMCPDGKFMTGLTKNNVGIVEAIRCCEL